MCGLSLVAASRGYSSLWCTGFSLQWLLLLWSSGSRHAGFSSCGSRALERRLSSCDARAQLLHGMWDLPGPGLEPVFPALAGRFLTTVPPGKPLCGGFLQTQFKLEWTSSEIINTKEKEGTKSTRGLKNVFFQEAKAPDYKCRRPQCKERWRQPLEMSRCREAVRKGRGDVDACPVTETAQSGSMTCFFWCPMPRQLLCLSGEGNYSVLSLKCHWNISFPFSIVTKILELNNTNCHLKPFLSCCRVSIAE